MNFIKKLKRHGLKGSLIFFRLVGQKYYVLRARELKYLEYTNPNQSDLNNIGISLSQRGITIADYSVDVNSFGKFRDEFQFGDDFYCGTVPLYDEKVLEHYVAYDMGGIGKMKEGGYKWILCPKILGPEGFA